MSKKKKKKQSIAQFYPSIPEAVSPSEVCDGKYL